MSQFPKDDRELISFLQQYRPLPPPADSDLEKQIYLRVSHESQHRKYSRLRWLVPSITSSLEKISVISFIINGFLLIILVINI